MQQSESFQKQLHEAEMREQATYRALEEKRRNYDALLVTQLADAATKERLQGEVGEWKSMECRRRRRRRSCRDCVKYKMIWTKRYAIWKFSIRSYYAKQDRYRAKLKRRRGVLRRWNR